MRLGERRSIRVIYIRWAILLIGLGLIVGFSTARYYQEVWALSPEQMMAEQPQGPIRVFGQVIAGTLNKQPDGGTFEIEGKSGGSLRVRYIGNPDENLRDLKRVVIEGEWDSSAMEIRVKTFHLPSHYGFIAAAYLLALIPLVYFLFNMEREVIILSLRIKEAKPYEPMVALSTRNAPTPSQDHHE